MTAELLDARRRYRRAWVASIDLMEAGVALNSYLTARSCFQMDRGGEDDLQNTKRCLMGFAIVAYMRPFKRSKPHPDATGMLTLEEIGVRLNERGLQLHDRVEFLRDRIVAHSDFHEKELIPEGRGIAKAVGQPGLLMVEEIEHGAFLELAQLVQDGIQSYMAKLFELHGESLMH